MKHAPRAPSSPMLTKTDLRGRGWTEGAITRWLGEPDKRSRNPYSRSAPPVCLFLETRVTAAEAGADFQAWLVERRERGQRATAAASTQADALVDALKQWMPPLAVLPAATIRRAAIDAYNMRLASRWDGSGEAASETSDEAFLLRITVNYLRHEMTSYDATLDGVRGRIGVRRAESAIRARVYEVIAEKYPDLAEECRRQLADRAGRSG